MSEPIDPVNCSRPYSCRALILQAITPLRELGSGHARLVDIVDSVDTVDIVYIVDIVDIVDSVDSIDSVDIVDSIDSIDSIDTVCGQGDYNAYTVM